jgi:MFS family permease
MAPNAAPPKPGLTRNVWALGITSLFTDVSSEMIVPVLPLFVTGVLHASVASLGVIEGVAESTASLLRLSSGWLSDRIGRRKPFLLVGYGLSAVAKTTFALAGSWGAVLGLRFADRVGKGLRNPPRDALLADSVAPAWRGRAFGLHRALDTLGAAIGPLVAFALLARWPEDFRRVFLVSAVPAALSLLALALFVRAPRTAAAKQVRALHLEFRALPAPVKRFLVADGVFQLANSSMAFVMLRARDGGIPAAAVPLAYLLYNAVYAALSLPAGTLSDRFGRRPFLLAAYALYAVAYAALAWSGAPVVVLAALAVYGVHSALIEVSQRSLLADLVDAERRGTVYGLYHTVVGLALLPASILAGWLWDRFGARVTFGVDAVLALVAAALFVVLLPSHREQGDIADAAAR